MPGLIFIAVCGWLITLHTVVNARLLRRTCQRRLRLLTRSLPAPQPGPQFVEASGQGRHHGAGGVAQVPLSGARLRGYG